MNSNLTNDSLADKINYEHRQAEQSARTALQHAMRCGELLAEAKAKLPHGEFSQWVEAHCDFALRTGQAYMRLHSHRAELDEKRNGVAHLNVRDALTMLAEPKSDDDGLARWNECCAKIDAARAGFRKVVDYIDQNPGDADAILAGLNEPWVAAGRADESFTLADLREIAGVAA
ncbi:MAG: DUF3102 domain-containing protein [Phycisphaerae bacterium]